MAYKIIPFPKKIKDDKYEKFKLFQKRLVEEGVIDTDLIGIDVYSRKNPDNDEKVERD